MKRSVIYCRISSDKPYLQKNTFTDQEKRSREQADNFNAEVVKIYREIGKGDDADRGKLIALKAYLDLYCKKIDYLIISKGKRLARSAEIATDIVNLLRKCNIELIACDFPNLRSEESYANFIKIAAEGKLDKINISRRTKQAINQRKSEGKSWGRPRKGYKMKYDDKKKCFVLIDRDIKEIKRMFSLASQGYSIKEIQTQLQKEGYELISDSVLRYRLKNKNYAGYVKDINGHWIKGVKPPILDESLFNDVQKLSTDKKKRTIRRERTQKNEELPLRNWLFCKKCGNPFTGSRIYYRCNGCSINRKNEVLHDELTEFLNIFDYSDDYADGVIMGHIAYSKMFYTELIEMIDRHNKQITTLEQAIEELDRQYLRSKYINQSVYESERKIFMKEKEELARRVQQIYHLFDSLKDTIDNLPMMKLIGIQWKDNTFEKKISLLQEIFPDRLSYDGSNFMYGRLSSSFRKIELYTSSNLERINSVIKTFKAQINHVSRPDVIDPKDYIILLEIYHEVNMRIDWPNRSLSMITS